MSPLIIGANFDDDMIHKTVMNLTPIINSVLTVRAYRFGQAAKCITDSAQAVILRAWWRPHWFGGKVDDISFVPLRRIDNQSDAVALIYCTGVLDREQDHGQR